MNNLVFQVQIEGAWQALSPIYNDFGIKKVREQDQIFIMRTVASGQNSLNFYCEDYELLQPYAGGYLQAKVTENTCGSSHTWEATLNISENYNFDDKKIMGSITLKDEYYPIIDKANNVNFNEDYNFQFSINADGILFYDKDLALFSRNISRLDNVFSLMLQFMGATRTVFDKFYGRSIADVEGQLGVQNLALSNDNNIYLYFEDDKTRKPIIINLENLVDELRKKLFIGWHLIDITPYTFYDPSIYDYMFVFDLLNNETLFYNWIDATLSEVRKDKVINLLNDKKYSVIDYKTFDFDIDNDDATSENFATQKARFDVDKDNVKIEQIELNSDILKIEEEKKNKLQLFDVINNNNVVNYSNFSKQWFNSETTPFIFADGDSDALTLRCDGTPSLITLDQILFSDCNINILIDGLTAVPNNTFYLRYGTTLNEPLTNSNNFTITNYSPDVPITIYCDDTTTDITFAFRFNIYPTSSNYYVANGLLGVKNGTLGTERLFSNFGAEMPKDTGKMNASNYNVTQYNNFIQQINYDFEGTMNDIKPFGLVKTSQGWLRIDEAERRYSNNSTSSVLFTLSGKK